jgi:hypothetical protein
MLQPRSSRLKSDIRALALGSALLALPLATAFAQSTLPPVSIGAGVRASFAHSETDATPSDLEADDFELNSARIYISGKVMDNLGIMFNTEYNTSGETIRVIDAAAQFSFADEVNIWVGRFLPPSDRANLYGPYYASHWGVYRDGIQDGYPFETEGRADGVMYWGQFGIAKVSAGVFDIAGLNKGSTDVMSAARVQLDFWDPEAGYYLNGTYYGDKDLLAVGLAAQNNAGSNAYSADFLFEKNLSGAGVVTVEAEYAKYDGLGGYPSPRGTAYTSSNGFYVLGAYMLPMDVGVGKFQVLAKVAKAEYDFTAVNTDVDQDTTEVNFNYIMKQFNARISAFYIDVDYDSDVVAGVAPDGKTYGIGLQVQM